MSVETQIEEGFVKIMNPQSKRQIQLAEETQEKRINLQMLTGRVVGVSDLLNIESW